MIIKTIALHLVIFSRETNGGWVNGFNGWMDGWMDEQ